MNNEPVAYLMVERNDGNSYIQMGVPTRDEKISHHPYPLYPHPVKELSDERIKQIFADETGFNFDDNPGDGMALMDFVRAVLKEAQG